MGSVSDNCTESASITITQTPQPGAPLEIADSPHTILLAAEDATGNRNECAFVVAFEAYIEGEIAEGEGEIPAEGEEPVEGEVPVEGEIEGEAAASVHPADSNADWRMVISEAIAYLAGWQQGSNPLSYAIRAAYLWQNGENYAYDSGQEPPLCWTPAP